MPKDQDDPKVHLAVDIGMGIVLTFVFATNGFGAHGGANISKWSPLVQKMWDYVPISWLIVLMFVVIVYFIKSENLE